MKIRICFAATLLFTGCTHTPDPPEEVYICEASTESAAGRFSATKYLKLDGQLRRWSTDDNELSWYLNKDDGGVDASFRSRPWNPDAFNHQGKVSLRVYWTDPLPVGTRIFMKLPRQGFAFEGFPIGERSASSGIYTDWPPFKNAIKGHSEADIVFTTPNGEIIRQYPIALEKFHLADRKLQELKTEVDRMSLNYETACRKETLEYIIVT